MKKILFLFLAVSVFCLGKTSGQTMTGLANNSLLCSTETPVVRFSGFDTLANARVIVRQLTGAAAVATFTYANFSGANSLFTRITGEYHTFNASRFFDSGVLPGATVDSMTATYRVLYVRVSNGGVVLQTYSQSIVKVHKVPVPALPAALSVALDAGAQDIEASLAISPPALAGTPWSVLFSGPGMNGGSFEPSVAGVGTHTISAYAYHSALLGCGALETMSVTVTSIPAITGIGAPQYCEGETLSVTGTELANYTSASLQGNALLAGYTATATITGGGTAATFALNNLPDFYQPQVCTLRLAKANNPNQFVSYFPVVLQPTAVLLYGGEGYYCQNAARDTIFALPTGGTFTPGNAQSFLPFNPAQINAGTTDLPVSVAYYLGQTCATGNDTLVASFSTVIGPNLLGNITLTRYTFFSGEASVDLNTLIDTVVQVAGMPAIFAGGNVYNNIYTPPQVLADSSDIIFYLVINPFTGCVDTQSLALVIRPAAPPTSIPGVLSYYCDNDPNALLTIGSLYPGAVTEEVFVSVVGTNNLVSQSFFIPNPPFTLSIDTLPTGFYRIDLVYSAIVPDINNILFYYYQVQTDTFEVTNCSSNGIADGDILCPNGTSRLFIVSPGADNDTIKLDGVPFAGNQLTIDPSQLSPGAHVISYLFSGQIQTISFTIQSLQAPTITGLATAYCSNASPVTLSLSPSGGTVKINNISQGQLPGNIYELNPSVLQGNNFDFTYEVTDTLGCKFSATTNVGLVSPQTVQILQPADGTVLCSNAAPITLQASINNGGTYLLNGGPLLQFNPALFPGVSTILYQTQDNSPQQCLTTTSVTVEVRTAPTLSISGLSALYCPNQTTAVSLTGSPVGGTFTVDGVPQNSFLPQSLNQNLASHTVVYAYTSVDNVCTVQSTSTFQLHPSVNPQLTGPGTLCENQNTANFTVAPTTGFVSLSAQLGSLQQIGLATYRYFPNDIAVNTRDSLFFFLTDPNGCSWADTLTLNLQASRTLSMAAENGWIICTDSTAQLEVSPLSGGAYWGGGAQFTWFTPGGTLTGQDSTLTAGQAGTYTAQVTEGVCTVSVSRVLSQVPQPALSIVGLSSLYCTNDNGTVVLQGFPNNPPATGNGFFLLNNAPLVGDTTFVPASLNQALPVQVLRYVYSDSICSAVRTETFDFYPTIIPQITVVDTLCENSTATVLASPIGTSRLLSSRLGSISPGVAGPNNTLEYTYEPPQNVTALYTRDTLTYTLTDNNGCTWTVQRVIVIQGTPEPVILSSLGRAFCFGENTTLTVVPGSLPGWDAAQTAFTWTGNGVAAGYNADSLVTAEDSIFSVTVAYGVCVEQDTLPIAHFALPTPVILGFDDSWCPNDAFQNLSQVVAPTPTGSDDYFRIFSASFDTLLLGGGNFVPSLYPPDAYTLRYTYEDANGCSSETSANFELHGLPQLDYTVSGFCAGEDIVLTDNSEIALPNPFNDILDSVVFIVTGQLLEVSPGASIVLAEPNVGPFTVRLFAHTDAGCATTSAEASYYYGEKPQLDFLTYGNCENRATVFVPEIDLQEDSVALIRWFFGTASPNATVQYPPVNGVFPDTNYYYNNPGTYPVTLTVQTNRQCVDSVTRRVVISPLISDFPYRTDFANGPEDWFAENLTTNDTAYIWQWANNAGATGAGWQTRQEAINNGANIIYPSSAKGWVYGPCFDLRTLNRPMLGLDLRYETQATNDGALVQFSIDGGRNWNILGDDVGGLNWYNGLALAGFGLQPDGAAEIPYGWSGASGTGGTWVNARHKLDQFKLQSELVRFRMSFASDQVNPPNTSFAGVRFDNVVVSSRSRNVLMEYYSNTGTAWDDERQQLYGVLRDRSPYANVFNPLDLQLLQYHSFPTNGDAYYDANPNDPSARALYYGLNGPGYVLVNGQFLGNGQVNNLNQDQLDLAMMGDPAFSLRIDSSLVTGQNVRVNLTVKALKAFPQLLRARVQVAAIEDRMDETGDSAVLRKMLPNAAGTALSRTWAIGDSVSLQINGVLPAGAAIDPDSLYFLAFLQDSSTKAVYQTTTTRDLSYWVAVDVPTVSWRPEVRLYPNPATEAIHVFVQSAETGTCRWQIIDASGRQVMQGGFERALPLLETIPVAHLPGGTYFLLLENGTSRWATSFVKGKP